MSVKQFAQPSSIFESSDALLGRRFEAAARARDEAIAITDGPQQISYRELLLRAEALARELESREIGPGNLVGVILPRSADLVVAVIGIVLSGAAYVPVDITEPAERRARILADARPKLVVTDGTEAEGIPADIELFRLPQHMAPEVSQRSRPRNEDPAYVIYTSGSTGQPKGVIVTQRNAARLFTITEPLFKFDSNDVWALFHSIGFDFSVWELWGSLLHGGRLVVVPATTARAADAFHALVIREGVTVLNQTPSAFRALDAADTAAGRPPNQLRHIVFAGEALDPRTLRNWIEAHGDERPRLANMYGITETTVHTTHRRMIAKDANGSSASLIGAPLEDLRIELLDPDGKAVTNGDVGEIFVGGQGVTAGYLGRPDLTAERFLPDPHGEHPGARLYRSGDLARRMDDGDLEYIGRIDAQVKLRGFRIELGEIEAALSGHPEVMDSVVALRDGPKRGSQLVAYVVTAPLRAIDTASLRDYVAQRLPDYMVPAAYIRIQQIPRTINDKIDRSALPPPTAADYPAANGGTAPRDDTEIVIAQIFTEVLETSVTTRESNFFQLGGDSLLAMSVVIRCHELLQVNLPMSEVLDKPTVAGLAERIRHERQRAYPTNQVVPVSRSRTIPLSPQQFALWLELKVGVDVDAYHETLAFRVRRRLEPERLRRALVQLARTHEVLRARLVEIAGEPHFAFDRDASAIDLQCLDANCSDKLLEAVHQPFDLEMGPLWRPILCNERDGGSIVVLVIHHIISDHESEAILLSELVANYSKPGDKKESLRAYDLADIATHERLRLNSEREVLERFWIKTLASASPTLDLPPPCVPCSSDRQRDACTSRRELGPTLVQRVRRLASTWGYTPFHLYFTAYLAILRKYGASDDLVVGSPLSLRDISAADGVVGYLLSPTVLRVQLDGERTFHEAVGEVAVRWREVCAHARLPLNIVVSSALGSRRTVFGSPIQTWFSLARNRTESMSIDDCALEEIQLPSAHAKFDLFLLVQERKNDASLMLDYRRGRFDPNMADRFLGHLEMLLRAAIDNPDSCLAMLPLIDQAEIAQLRRWGSHSTSYPSDRTVVEIFEQVARKYHGNTAVVSGGIRVSYAELADRAHRIAALLRRTGVNQGDRVPLLLPRGIQFIAAALGVMMCGAAYVPLDPTYPSERLRRMLDGLHARFGLASAGVSLSNGTMKWIDVGMTGELPSGLAPAQRRMSGEDPAYIMFTSGSSGQPKGVEVPHRAILRLVLGQDFASMGPNETWLHMAPTSFDASTLEIWAALLHGGRCVILEDGPPNLFRLGEVIDQEKVTSAWITSPLFNVIIDDAPNCLSGLKQILIGGEALSPSHVRRALDHLSGVRLINGYGPTENTTFTCCHVIRREDTERDRTIPIGRPIANTTVHVLDSDGQVAPVGVPGELVTGGDGVALGYVGQPEQTRQRFPRDTFSSEPGARLYRTADRVRWRPDGLLEFLGRTDDQVKIRGHRIEPDEVAACLIGHDAVLQAVVVPHRVSIGATQLFAYIVPAGNHYSERELRAELTQHAAEHLPSYMLPAQFLFLERLPLTPNGKLDVAALENATHPSSRVEIDEPTSLAESRILAIMRDVLGNDDLTINEDFLECGGDSLLAIKLFLRFETAFEKDFTANAIKGPFTAKRLAAYLEAPLPSQKLYPTGALEIRAGSTDRPLFCLPGLPATALQFSGLAAKLNTQRPIVVIEPHNLQLGTSSLQSIESIAQAIVATIRKVQPEGPYTILGYSFGGYLAVEASRQLATDNQSLELVVVLDTHIAGSTRDPTGLRKLATHLRLLARQRPYELYTYVSSRVRKRLFGRPQKADDAQASTTKSDIERALSEFSEHCSRALSGYRPEAFSGKIVLFSATDLDDWTEVVDRSGTFGWGSVCEGGVDVVPMACHHLDLLKQPELPKYISNLLEAVDRKASI
jgi:amino acid adenylation domain-containing protein